MIYGIAADYSQTGATGGTSAGGFVVPASLALLRAAGDALIIMRGLFAAQRMARHFWRMCFALFIASISIFLARPQLFPDLLRKTGVLFLLGFLPLLLMIFWLIKFRSKKERPRNALPSSSLHELPS